MTLTRLVVLAALAAIAASGSRAAAQNLLANPGFEDASKFVHNGSNDGQWGTFNGNGMPAPDLDMTMPRTGLNDAHLATNNAHNAFAGISQNVSAGPGAVLTFTGFNKADQAPFGPVTEVRFEYYTATNTEVGLPRVNLNPVLTTNYAPFSWQVTVPNIAGIVTARAVYAVQTFTPAGTSDAGQVFLDDFSVTKVPEPSSVALIGLAAAGLLGMRWRRS
jgi:hypothetical protein